MQFDGHQRVGLGLSLLLDGQTGRMSCLEAGMMSVVPSVRRSTVRSLAHSTSAEVSLFERQSSDSFFRSCFRSFERDRV